MLSYDVTLANLESYGLYSLAIFDICGMWNDGDDWDDDSIRDISYELLKKAAKQVIWGDEKSPLE